MTAIKGAVPGVTTVTFNYKAANTDWVTNPAIGPQLAQCITWLARTSLADGGPGQVIIVAHSLGGLAVRCAVDAACVQNGGKGPAADPSMIGLVITLGTPNTGSMLASAATSFASGYKGPKTRAKPAGPIENLDWLLCQHIRGCEGVALGYDSPAARAMQPGSAQLDPAVLKPLPSSIPLDAIAGKISLTTTLLTAGLYALPTGADVGDAVVSVGSAQDTQGVPPHPAKGNWQPTIDCGSIPVDSFVPGLASGVPVQLPDLKCWHETETTDAVWQQDIITAIQPVAQALSLHACTRTTILAALAVRDPANAAQRTLVGSACEGPWGVASVRQPLTLNDGSVVQDNGVALLQRTDSGWVSDGLSDGTCLGAPGICPGVALPPPAVLHRLLQEAGLGVSPTQAELYINTVFTPGALYKYPTGPAKIGIDNHNYIDGLQWAPGNQGDLVGTGTMHYDDCNPSCAGGTYHVIPVQITASQPQQCSVQLYPDGLGNPSQTVNADVFNRIDVQPLQGSPPSPLVGTSVLPQPCT